MRYTVKAVRDAGAIEIFECEALNAQDAMRQAGERGCSVLSLSPAGFAAWRPRFALLLFSQELAALLGAGVPLLEAIETLALKERADMARSLLGRMATVLREGKPLSAAMEQMPVFPPLYVATVRAAEHTGDLSPSLLRYVAYQTRLDAVAKKVTSACIYPALLLAVGAAVCLFLLFYVVPRFSLIYQSRGEELPLFSRLLLEWGAFSQANGVLLLALLALAAAAGFALLRSAAGRARLLGLLLAWPAAAERLRQFHLARFYRTTGMLLRGGIPMLGALQMAGGVLGAGLQGALESATRAVREGKSAAAALEASGLTTPVAGRLLAVGERSSKMGQMLEQAAEFHEDELARSIDVFSRLFEPLLMAAIGLVIGLIVVLMYMPIFELAGSVG